MVVASDGVGEDDRGLSNYDPDADIRGVGEINVPVTGDLRRDLSRFVKEYQRSQCDARVLRAEVEHYHSCLDIKPGRNILEQAASTGHQHDVHTATA